MKNINIPPHISFIAGVVLMIIGWIFLGGVISDFIGFLGFIVAAIGFAGLIGKLFNKKKKKHL